MVVRKNSSLPNCIILLCAILAIIDTIETATVSSENPYEFLTFERSRRRTGQSANSTRGCILPQHPNFGRWSIVGDGEGKPSEKTPFNTVLEFNCNEGYLLSSEYKYIFCVGTEWYIHETLTCLKKCTLPNSTNSLSVNCFDKNDFKINCDQAVDGTSAVFQCAPYMELAVYQTKTRYCREGVWNFPVPICRPICGVKPDPINETDITVEHKNYPWIAQIYQKQSDGPYLLVCSGSMLTQRIILTAATCVSDYNGTSFILKEDLTVEVGKYYSKYKDIQDIHTQYSQVGKVIVPDGAMEERQHLAYDIAVLVTKEELILSKFVQPVCYQGLPKLPPTSEDIGVLRKYEISDKFKETEMTIGDQCQKIPLIKWNSRYYTFDRTCAKHYNESIIASKEDIGGGLFFKHDGRYHVHGILTISTLPKGNYLYTNVSRHYDWLDKVIAQNSIFFY